MDYYGTYILGSFFYKPIKIDKPIFVIVVVGLFAHHLVSISGMPEVISYLNLNLIELDSRGFVNTFLNISTQSYDDYINDLPSLYSGLRF